MVILFSFVTIFFLFFLGACVGSFLNVIIYRSTTGESWVVGRSHCESCKKPIKWFDNIPLFSFMLLGGKCRYCHDPLSISHPTVEGLMGLLFVWWYAVGFFFFKLTQAPFVFLQPIFWLLVAILLFVIFLIDYRYLIIPDVPVFFLSGLVIFYRIALVLSGIMQVNDLLWTIIATASVIVFFWCLWFFTKGKGFGFGDIKLALPLGLLVGWPGITVWILSSFSLGAVIGIILLACRKAKFGQPIPFGPFLILGALISLIWGDRLIGWYVTLIL